MPEVRCQVLYIVRRLQQKYYYDVSPQYTQGQD